MSSFITADYDGRHWWILQVLDDQIQFKKKLNNGKKNALKRAQKYAAENGVEFRPCNQHSFLALLLPRPKPDQLVAKVGTMSSTFAPMILRDIEPILGESNIFGVDDDGDSLSIVMMDHYQLGVFPMHPSESERPERDEVPYEYWEAAIAELEADYKEAARLIAEKLPEFDVTIGYRFEGPSAPGSPIDWCNEYFKEVPNSFELKLKTA